MRNAMGAQFGREQLSLRSTRDDDFEFDTNITKNISVGGDVRFQFIYEDFQETYTSQAMTAAFYGAIKLGSKIALFYKQDIINPKYGTGGEGFLSGPEVFGIGRILPNQWYIKFGAFYPNYGWRLDDHTAFVRGGNVGFISGLPFNQGLIFLPNYKDVGFEIGGTIGELFITAGSFNGSGNISPLRFDKDRAYVARGEYTLKFSSVKLRAGASYYAYNTDINYQMWGVTAGIAAGRIVLLGEIDWTNNKLEGPTSRVTGGLKTMAALSELDVLITDGIWGIIKYDLYDPNQGIAENILSRLTLGLEFFPYPMVEVRPQYRFEFEEDADGVFGDRFNNNVALIQLHLWF